VHIVYNMMDECVNKKAKLRHCLEEEIVVQEEKKNEKKRGRNNVSYVWQIGDEKPLTIFLVLYN